MKLTRPRQIPGHQRDKHQRQHAVDLPCCTGGERLSLDIDGEQPAERNTSTWPGKYRGAETRFPQLSQPLVGPGGNQHHRPAAHAANHKAQQAMYHGVIDRSGKQRQRNCTKNTQPEACFNEAVRTHCIPCSHQIAQIVHRRHQARAGERELPGGNH